MATSSTLHEVIWDRLAAITDITVYDGESPETPPTDPDARVSAYAVLYATPGRLSSTSLDGGQRCLLAAFQVTCVGGDQSRALGCVDSVRAQLLGVVTVDGLARVIRERPGRDSLIPDPKFPPRLYAPLEFELFAP